MNPPISPISARKFFSVALIVLAFSLLALGQASKHAEIDRLIKADHLDEAEQQIWTILQAKPTDPWALDHLATIRVHQKRDSEAEALFRRAFEVDSKDVQALRGLGAAASQRGAAKEATEWYTKLLAISPTDVDARKALAKLQTQAGDYQASADSVQKIPVASRTPDLLPVLAADYLALKDEKKVAPLIRQVLDMRGEIPVKLDFVAVLIKNGYLDDADKLLSVVKPATPNADYLHLLARLREAQGRNEESWALLQQALQLDNKSFDLAFDAARFAAQHDRWEDSVKMLDRADAISPDRPEVLLKLSLALLKTKRREKAITVARRLNTIQPNDYDSQYVLAFALVDNEQWEMATPIAEKMVAARPNDANAHLLMGIITMSRGQNPQAKEELTRAIAINPNLLDAHYYLALLYEHTGDIDDARNELSFVVKASPNHAGAQAELGMLDLRAGDLQGARTALEAAIKLDPDVSQTHYQLGLAYARLGMTDNAKTEMDTYQKLRTAEDNLRKREAGLKPQQ